MTDSINWHRYDITRAKRLLSGAWIRLAITIGATALGVVLMVVGIVNIRQLGLFFIGLFLVIVFGIFLLVFAYSGANSRHAFGRLTGGLVGFSSSALSLEAITLPWEGIARIAFVNRQLENYVASTPSYRFGLVRVANAIGFSGGQGEVIVSITVTHGEAARAALSPRDKGFITVPKKSTLPDPRRGQFVFTPDVVMHEGEVEALRMALRSAATSRGIEYYETDSTTDFTTKNFAAMGITL